ncbi:nickel-binding protein [Pricia sp.]|uniref:nickel-binding protein n=1 Tax=Pricia sp. TaxID=2268138 RepID=UPI0035937670
MPLFIDIHVVEDKAFSEIALQEGHHKDIAVQHRFGVKHVKYFLNLPEKKVFCLMEAPQ